MMKLLALHKRNSHKSHEVAETSVELDEALHKIVHEIFLAQKSLFSSSQQAKNRSKFKYPAINILKLALHKRNSHKSHEVRTSGKMEGVLYEIA